MILRKENENEEQFLWRLGEAKSSGILDSSWEEIADLMNKEFREDISEYRSEAAYRKPYQQAKKFFESGVFNKSDDDIINEIRAERQEIRKEKQKLSDERAALNKVLRESARRESMYEIVKSAIDERVEPRFDYEPCNKYDSDNDLIIHLTDVHYGVDIKSPVNTFNPDILIQRLKKYLNEIIEIKNTYDAQDAYVILGGDSLAGIIHINARIEAKENLVQQIMNVSDIIADFVKCLSNYFNKVHIYTTAGNHCRTVANKEESVGNDNFDLLIPYVCKKELQNVTNVEFVDNYLDYDIANFMVRGHSVYATHGDKDTPSNVVYHMTNYARMAGLPLPDICYLGHRHTNGLMTVDGVKVIQSGCCDGVDSYALSKRLAGYPEQTVTVVSENKLIKALCDIQLI